MKEFREWLKRSAGLGDRSAKDVASRLRRASRLVKVDSAMDTEDVLHKMAKHPEFKALSATVRSQLRRAVKLHRDFAARK